MPLPLDTTIKKLIKNGSLEKPEEWLRVTLQNMANCRSVHGNCMMQIGITGTGRRPFHKVAYIDEAGTIKIFGAFDGRNPFTGVDIHDGSTWSNVATSFQDVQQVLGKLRGFKPKTVAKG